MWAADGALHGGSPRQEAMNCWAFAQQRTQGPVALAGWPDTERYSRIRWLRRKSETSKSLDCEGIKAQRFLCSGSPPWRHQLELVLCYCAVNKLLSEMEHLRLCYGKPRVELVRKPGVTLHEWGCGEPSGVSCKGLWSQQWKAPVVGVWLPESLQLLWEDLKRNLGGSVWRNQQLISPTFDSPRANDITQFTSSFWTDQFVFHKRNHTNTGKIQHQEWITLEPFLTVSSFLRGLQIAADANIASAHTEVWETEMFSLNMQVMWSDQ